MNNKYNFSKAVLHYFHVNSKDKKGKGVTPMKPTHMHMSTERCVLCCCDTGIPRDTPISARSCYVEGCGQLCVNCWRLLVKSHSFE